MGPLHSQVLTLNTMPAMVVPVFTGLGIFTPARFRASFLHYGKRKKLLSHASGSGRTCS